MFLKPATIRTNKTSEIINTILANIEDNPAISRGISLASPYVINPSLTPKPIGAITDKKLTRKERAKKPVKYRLLSTGRQTIEETARYDAKEKAKKEAEEMKTRIKFSYGLNLGRTRKI